MSASKQYRFADLVARVQRCNLCPRMQGRSKVLGAANGSLDSPVVFIAEAPGRLGADRFGVPLYGDQTGRNFQSFLDAVGLSREAIFITNAVLCNPRKPDGNNDSPRLTEIRNCSRYLEETLKVVQPKYVVTLGTAALVSLHTVEPHGVRLSEGVGQPFPWRGYVLYPLFHPGPRACIWRNKAKQLEDYGTLATLLGKLR